MFSDLLYRLRALFRRLKFLQLLYAITLLQEKIQQERGSIRKTLNLT